MYAQDNNSLPVWIILSPAYHHISTNSQPFLVGIVSQNSKHGSLVDRGANGGLAGSDVRILGTSSRICTVTGIDNHEIPGLDLVQCAALVETNHGMVTLIMNEYAYYGKGHSIHSSGQIEWYTNTVDDKSVQVGGQQRIVTIDGYSMPLVCKGGLMYLQLQGIPTDQD